LKVKGFLNENVATSIIIILNNNKIVSMGMSNVLGFHWDQALLLCTSDSNNNCTALGEEMHCFEIAIIKGYTQCSLFFRAEYQNLLSLSLFILVAFSRLS